MSSPAAGACRNCGAATDGKYCPECGQETAPHPPTAAEFLHEFVGHYIALEGALWRTLRKLVVPGELTLEYFAGRKRRYVLPLRLYLTASVVFFIVTKLLVPASSGVVLENGKPLEGRAPFTLRCDTGPSSLCGQTRARILEKHPGITNAQVATLMRDRVLNEAPYAMFFLVPVFAWLTRIAYRKRPYNYGEHLVFALHVHAFAFFLGALVAPLHVAQAMTIPASIYLGAAMKRVFGGRTGPLVLRFLLVALAYSVLVIAAISLLGMAALFI